MATMECNSFLSKGPCSLHNCSQNKNKVVTQSQGHTSRFSCTKYIFSLKLFLYYDPMNEHLFLRIHKRSILTNECMQNSQGLKI